jgi:hypothetical protein
MGVAPAAEAAGAGTAEAAALDQAVRAGCRSSSGQGVRDGSTTAATFGDTSMVVMTFHALTATM